MFVIATSLAADAMRAQRRLAKYSRFNASAKGRDRIEKYRSTAKGIFARLQAELNQHKAGHAVRLEELEARQ